MHRAAFIYVKDVIFAHHRGFVDIEKLHGHLAHNTARNLAIISRGHFQHKRALRLEIQHSSRRYTQRQPIRSCLPLHQGEEILAIPTRDRSRHHLSFIGVRRCLDHTLDHSASRGVLTQRYYRITNRRGIVFVNNIHDQIDGGIQTLGARIRGPHRDRHLRLGVEVQLCVSFH